MAKTKHMQARMGQRAINERLLEIVHSFGVALPNGRRLLNRQALQCLQTSLRRLLRDSERALQKGGMGVVEVDGLQITAFGLGQKRKRTARSNARQLE